MWSTTYVLVPYRPEKILIVTRDLMSQNPFEWTVIEENMYAKIAYLVCSSIRFTLC